MNTFKQHLDEATGMKSVTIQRHDLAKATKYLEWTLDIPRSDIDVEQHSTKSVTITVIHISDEDIKKLMKHLKGN